MYPIVGTIFMLHRITYYRNNNFIYNENLKISPEELDTIIKGLKRSGKVFLSLDEAVEIINNKRKSKHKFIVFTLDDGYKDNLEHGYSIFKTHNVPFCIYITNSFPNQTTDLWWYALGDLVMRNERLGYPNGKKLDNSTISKKKRNFLFIREKVLNEHFRDSLSYLRQLGEVDFDILEERNKKCLTWDEIKKLSRDPLVTIGCHTVNHYPLSKLSRQEVEFEIVNSKRELEQQLSIKVNHFAFPFGSIREANKREYEIVRSIGFNSIVTTVHGHAHLNDDLQKLDRVFLFPLQKNSSTLSKVMYWNVKTLISLIRKSV